MVKKITIFDRVKSLNNSKFFAGIVMLVLNIGSKYITIELSKSQEQYLRNTIARHMLIFSIAWMGTRDIFLSIGLTACFNVLTLFLFNEESRLCIIPKSLRNYSDVIAANDEELITEKKIKEAYDVIDKAKKQNRKKDQLRLMNSFTNLKF
tara:strand:- start:148 stop:600 length:453 start_codon:yes stop_codon:yes gene_type:complete